MQVQTEYINVNTKGMTDIHDITPKVNKAVQSTGMTSGTVTIFAPGSTAGITTLEYEPGLNRDIPERLDKIAPYGPDYHHHETWHDDNGAAHVRAALISPSLVTPFVNGRLTLGTWQQIVLIDFDTRPRDRGLVLQIMGA